MPAIKWTPSPMLSCCALSFHAAVRQSVGVSTRAGTSCGLAQRKPGKCANSGRFSLQQVGSERQPPQLQQSGTLLGLIYYICDSSLTACTSPQSLLNGMQRDPTLCTLCTIGKLAGCFVKVPGWRSCIDQQCMPCCLFRWDVEVSAPSSSYTSMVIGSRTHKLQPLFNLVFRRSSIQHPLLAGALGKQRKSLHPESIGTL